MSGDMLLPIAALGATALTAGAAAPALAGAASGAAAGAGASTVAGLGAGHLATQGATGLLGAAGANAAGYGAGAAQFGGLLGGAADSAIPTLTADTAEGTMTSFGPNSEYFGKSITDGTGMTANAYTGGYDSLNGLERLGQRASGFMDDGGLGKINKFRQAFGGQQQQPEGRATGSAPRQVAKAQMQDSAPSQPMYGGNSSQGVNLSQLTPQQLEILRQRFGV